MGCNCGKPTISIGYPVNVEGVGTLDEFNVRLEYVSKEPAFSTVVRGREYRGGTAPAMRFIDVREDDAEELVATGFWKEVKRPSVQKPDAETSLTITYKTDTAKVKETVTKPADVINKDFGRYK